MNRTYKAIVTVIFGYAQYGLVLVSGLFLLPFTLSHLDVRDFGLWQVCLELVVYVGFIDLGVINVLPWMIAECDGRKDRKEMRSLFVNALTLGLAGSAVYLGTIVLAWPVLLRLTGLESAELERFEGPLQIMVGVTALLFPLRVFHAVLAGLQDVAFLGWLTLLQAALTIGLTIALLSLGFGLYALAWVSAPTVLYSLVMGFRLAWLAPDLFLGWSRPSPDKMLAMIGQGLTTWVATVGWRLTAASNSLWIISSGGLPETVVVFSCTAKLGEMLMQLAWQGPDGALAGLAQLQGEGRPERVRQVVLLMLRVLLGCVGGAVIFLLVVNPAFVTVWVGADKWGGYWLNLLFGLGILSLSVTHGLFVPAAVVGQRFRVGIFTLVQGLGHAAMALTLGSIWGVWGVAGAVLVSSWLIAVPLAIHTLGKSMGLGWFDLWREMAGWFWRAWPALVGAALLSWFLPPDQPWTHFLAVSLPMLMYLLALRPLLPELPWPHFVRKCLIRICLLPARS